jgi:hypothetical protein
MSNKLNSLPFYKPNSSNKGIAGSFNLNSEDGAVYLSLIRQASWDAVRKIGSFKGNSENPAAKKNVKFSNTEISGIIRAIEGQIEWSGYHKVGEGKGTSLKFGPYIKKDQTASSGFVFRISESADNAFTIGFTHDETVMLREWLKSALSDSFRVEAKVAPESN